MTQNSQTLHIYASDLLNLIEQVKPKGLALNLGPWVDAEISDNNFGGKGIHIDGLTNGVIDKNDNIGYIEIPRGGKNIKITRNTFISSLQDLSQQQRINLVEALRNPNSHKSRLKKFFQSVLSNMATDTVKTVLIHTVNKGLVELHLPQLPQ